MQNQIPDNWQLKKLTQLGELNRGRSRHRPRDARILYGGPYPFIQTGDVKASGGRITSYSQTYSENGLKQSRMWPVNTICITIAANIADLGKLTFPACFPDSVIGFLADEEKSDPDFILYSLQYLKRNIQSYAIGSAQDNINLGTFENVLVPTPPLSIQKKISRILAALDEKIEVNNKISKTLEEMAQTFFKKWFSSNEGTKYSLLDIANYINGGAFGKITNRMKKGLPLIKIADLNRGVSDNTEWIDKKVDDKYYIQNGDLLFSWSGTVDLYIWDKDKAILNQHIFNVVPTSDFSKGFIYFLLKSKLKFFQQQAGAKATTMGHIKKEHLKEQNIFISDNKNINIFDVTYRTMISLKLENQKLTALRDLLLPKLMKGEITI